MSPIGDFRLEPVAGGGPQAGQSRLWYRGHPTPLLVAGSVLERQFQCGPGCLLLTTDNSPFEEVLHVYLIGPGPAILDQLDLGQMYTPAVLSDVAVQGRDALTFSFFGGDRWRLRVWPGPRYTWPSGPFASVQRPWRFLLRPHFLELTRTR
jgi:hypothetical protein